jgi:pyroglutamyl-peptidase
MPPERRIVLTGFEPFGGHAVNPSGEIARALDGRTIAGALVAASVLPVELARLDAALDAALAGPTPTLVVALGLAAGEPAIRLERVALNLADFAIPDNSGAVARGVALDPGGPAARLARLPLAAALDALLAAGIPARFSESAGAYLCNAAMYRLLARVPEGVPCGFVHLPQLPAQAAAALAARGGRGGETGLAGLASMALETQRRAVEIVLETALARPPESASPRA